MLPILDLIKQTIIWIRCLKYVIAYTGIIFKLRLMYEQTRPLAVLLLSLAPYDSCSFSKTYASSTRSIKSLGFDKWFEARAFGGDPFRVLRLTSLIVCVCGIYHLKYSNLEYNQAVCKFSTMGGKWFGKLLHEIIFAIYTYTLK